MSVRRDRGCSATQSQPLYKATIWVNLPCVHQGIANTCSTGENALRGEYYGDLHFSLVSAYHRGVMYSQCSKFIHFSFFFRLLPYVFFIAFSSSSSEIYPFLSFSSLSLFVFHIFSSSLRSSFLFSLSFPNESYRYFSYLMHVFRWMFWYQMLHDL